MLRFSSLLPVNKCLAELKLILLPHPAMYPAFGASGRIKPNAICGGD